MCTEQFECFDLHLHMCTEQFECFDLHFHMCTEQFAWGLPSACTFERAALTSSRNLPLPRHPACTLAVIV